MTSREKTKYPFIYEYRGSMIRMNRRHLWKVDHRKPGEQMKEKEKKCWRCGSLPHRVEGVKCKDCGLLFEEDFIEAEIPTLKSSGGTFENEF